MTTIGCHDCPSPTIHARGLCRRCYDRHHSRTYQPPAYPPCRETDCARAPFSHGLCVKHWRRTQRHGNTSPVHVDAAPTRAQLNMLTAEHGWNGAALAHALGLSKTFINELRRGRYQRIRRDTAAHITRLTRHATRQKAV